MNATIDRRRIKYSILWTFACLNYLYADLVGLMDSELLNQYLTGTVNGMDLNANFLTGAAFFMQIPMLSVILPVIIKSDKWLKWLMIIAACIMSLAQTASVFVGEGPTPYYVVFTIVEVATTIYIAFDAFNWKINRANP